MKTGKLLILLFISCLFFSSCSNSNPSTIQTPETKVFTENYPVPVGYVNDFEGLFTPAQVITLDSIIRRHEAETTNQVAIATMKAPAVISIDSFATRLSNHWGIGQANKNNGVLMLICPELRTVVIRNGYGIEDRLSNTETKKIIEEMIPHFRKGNYYAATLKGLLAVMEKIK